MLLEGHACRTIRRPAPLQRARPAPSVPAGMGSRGRCGLLGSGCCGNPLLSCGGCAWGEGPHRGIVQGGGERQGEGQEKRPGTDGLEGVSLLNSTVKWARHGSIPACECEHREQKFGNRKLVNCVDGDIRRCKAGG